MDISLHQYPDSKAAARMQFIPKHYTEMKIIHQNTTFNIPKYVETLAKTAKYNGKLKIRCQNFQKSP